MFRKTIKNMPPETISEMEKKMYSISKIYADCPIYENEECDPLEVELKIWLEFSDWCKFQDQSFYRELIQFLDCLKTRKHSKLPDGESNSQGDMGAE